MSNHAANDAQASTGSHDDESTASSTSAPDTPIGFYKRLAAWLTLYDHNLYLKDKVEGLQAAGPTSNEAAFTDAVVTERKQELRAHTSLQDWIQDHDPDGILMAQRNAALDHLGPLLEERSRLITEVVRTHNALLNTSTNSSGAADPRPHIKPRRATYI